MDLFSPDPNVTAVMELLKQRSLVGLNKYGTTTMRTDLDILDWLQHLQEELCDAAVYVEVLRNKLRVSD
jgi:hypothetical protein